MTNQSRLPGVQCLGRDAVLRGVGRHGAVATIGGPHMVKPELLFAGKR